MIYAPILSSLEITYFDSCLTWENLDSNHLIMEIIVTKVLRGFGLWTKKLSFKWWGTSYLWITTPWSISNS